MAPHPGHPGIDVEQIKEKGRKDLLDLIEGVCKLYWSSTLMVNIDIYQVPGKKNLVIEKGLASPVGILVKFSTLQEHGVDKVFVLENDNLDTSQKSVIFLARGEKATAPIAIAGR